MKNKKVLIVIYLLVILGVFYFVYNALVSQDSDNMLSNTLEVQTAAMDRIQAQGFDNFQAPDLNNKPVQLSDIKAPVVIINFWASWCGPCIEEFPSFIKLLNEMNDKVIIVAISVDADASLITKFLKDLNIQHKNLIVLQDPSYRLAEKYGTFKIPESYILNSERKLLRKISGSIDWASASVLDYFRTL